MRMKWRQIQHCFDLYSCTHIPLQWINYLVQGGALKIKSITNRNSLSKNIEQIRKYVLQNSVVGFQYENRYNLLFSKYKAYNLIVIYIFYDHNTIKQ
jgi:hypothetical protein